MKGMKHQTVSGHLATQVAIQLRGEASMIEP
jgi:hypothetical protein